MQDRPNSRTSSKHAASSSLDTQPQLLHVLLQSSYHNQDDHITSKLSRNLKTYTRRPLAERTCKFRKTNCATPPPVPAQCLLFCFLNTCFGRQVSPVDREKRGYLATHRLRPQIFLRTQPHRKPNPNHMKPKENNHLQPNRVAQQVPGRHKNIGAKPAHVIRCDTMRFL